MTDTITIRGFIATAPTQKYLPNSTTPVTNFRVASTPRWLDPSTGTWKEGNTNWYTINCFRALAHNCARSLQVGQPVLVTGRLRVKQFERLDGSNGTSIEIDASSLGHDLTYGLAQFTRISDRKPPADETDRRFQEQVQGSTGHEEPQPAWELPPAHPGQSQPGLGPQPGQQGAAPQDAGLTDGRESEAELSLTR